jgi:hypothetical protein
VSGVLQMLRKLLTGWTEGHRVAEELADDARSRRVQDVSSEAAEALERLRAEIRAAQYERQINP